jgi:hypothetical protein
MRHELEKDIQRGILDYLALNGFIAVKYHSTVGVAREGRYIPIKTGVIGTADILACAPDGRFWAIEVKRKGGRATPEQLAFLERVRKAGGVAILAHSIDDVIEVHRSSIHRVAAPQVANSSAPN